MAQKKKLQVFISSTYVDLKEERQAAVEAILTSGHIPAGMELFAAGDQSQMNVIKRWIDESDIYLMILGGRYGSVDPQSQKSYIQLEYEYAAEQGKPLFAIVIERDYLEEKVKKFGTNVIEAEFPQKLKEFRTLVLSKMVRFWRDPRDIKLAILETIAELSRRSELIGWIPGDEAINAGALAEEIARLTKENAALREQVTKLSAASVRYNGLTFEEMYKLLAQAKINISEFGEKVVKDFQDLAHIFVDPEPALIHIFWTLSEAFRQKIGIRETSLVFVRKLEGFGLVERDESSSEDIYKLTESGKQFLLRLRVERETEKAEEFVLQPKSVE
jgi:hypothetical protein